MNDLIIKLISLLVLAAQIGIIFYLIAAVFRVKSLKKVNVFVSRNGLLLSFAVSLIATLGSLFLSNIVGLTPCELCWFQRIVMYPQVVLFGLAFWKRDSHIAIYGAILSFMGLILSGYHYLLQINLAPVATSCSLFGSSTSCSSTSIREFGFITIPLMAFTAFLLLFLVQIIMIKNARNR
ncbi:MAG: disulfide oxidoreductase [bacterium]